MKSPFIRLLLIIVTSLLSFTACNLLPSPSGASLAEPAAITFSVTNATRDYYSTKVEAFKEVEPNITVKLETNVSQDLDVREVGWLDAQGDNAVVLDQALDLTPFIEQEKDFNRADFYPGLLDAFSRDGKLLALPSGVDPFVLFYNQDLFDLRGVAYPSSDLTWDEFKTLAMQIRDPAAGIYGYLPMDGYTDAIFFAFQHGAALLDGTQPQLNTIESIQALEWYATLYSDIGSAPTAVMVQSEFGGRGIYAALYQGMGGMWIAELSQLRQFNNDRIQYKVGIAPLPRDERSFTVAQFQGLVISSESEHPEAAWRWIRFLSAQAQPWSIPARRSIAESEQFTLVIGKDQAAVARGVVQNAQLINSFDMNLFQPVMEAYLTAVAQTVDGMLPASDTLTEAQEKMSP